MLLFALSLLFVALALMAVALKKTYAIVPPKELKRQAQQGDKLAKILYRAVAYDGSLTLLLWIVILVASAASFVTLSQVAPPILVFLLIVLIMAYGFVWMPHTEVTQFGVRLVVIATPTVTWLLSHLQPLTGRIVQFARRHRPFTVHTGLYEREDLLALLEQQKGQADSRLSNDDLNLLTHALTYGQKDVAAILTPRRVVRAVTATDDIGPIMMGELHDSGHSRFPVYGETEEQIVGTLYLRDLVHARKGGHVKDIMKKEVFYVHEDFKLDQVLHAFITTKHHLFIVVNSFEEYVGIVTIEDVLEQVIGRKIVDEFDQYEDMRAVAAKAAKDDHAKRAHVADIEAQTLEK